MRVTYPQWSLRIPYIMYTLKADAGLPYNTRFLPRLIKLD